MEEKQKILIVAENSGFIASTVAEQLSSYGYQVTIEELDIQKLFAVEGIIYEAILLYMESEIHGYTQALLYLKDKAVEVNTPIFYIGEDLAAFKQLVPAHIIKDVFHRPINVKESAKKIDDYIKINGRHVKKKILVVDDSGAMLRSVKEWLEDKYQVIFLTSKNDKTSIMKVMALKPEGYIIKNTPPEQIKKEIDDFFIKRFFL